MLASLESQIRLVESRLEEGRAALERDSVHLERVRAEKARVLTQREVLRQKLQALEERADALTAEEDATSDSLARAAEEYARVQLLHATVRRQLRAYQGYQQGIACLCYDTAHSESADAQPLLRLVTTTTVEETVGKRQFSFDDVMLRFAEGDKRSGDVDDTCEGLTQRMRDAVMGYNVLAILCASAPLSQTTALPLATVQSMFVDAVDTLLSCLMCQGQNESVTRLGAGQLPVVERFRLGCSVALVVEEGLVDVLDAPGNDDGARRDLLFLPSLENHHDDGTEKETRTPMATAAAVAPAHSTEDVVALAQRGFDAVAMAATAAAGAPAHLLIQLHVETFSEDGDYRQSIVRFLLMGFPGDEASQKSEAATATSEAGTWPEACLVYARDAAALCAKAGRSMEAMKTSSWPRDASLGGREEGLRRRLTALPSRKRVARSFAPLVDPAFGGNCRAVMLAVVDASPSTSSSRATTAPPPHHIVELLATVEHFHDKVRHGAAAFLVPAAILEATREVEAVILCSSDSDEEVAS